MILRNPNGNRNVLYLYWNDGQWNWNYNWLDNDWDADDPSAVLATLFISPLCVSQGSFYLVGLASRQAFCRFPQVVLPVQHIV